MWVWSMCVDIALNVGLILKSEIKGCMLFNYGIDSLLLTRLVCAQCFKITTNTLFHYMVRASGYGLVN